MAPTEVLTPKPVVAAFEALIAVLGQHEGFAFSIATVAVQNAQRALERLLQHPEELKSPVPED